MAEQEQGNIRQEYNNATVGLNMDQTPNQIKKGSLTYALNAAVENYDANSVNYQNEEGNELCLTFPDGWLLIGTHFINEKAKHIFFMVNPDTGGSQIGYMDNNDCQYKVLINAPCLNFDINHPVQKIIHKISNCGTEIYWTDGLNPRRYLDIDDIPKILKTGSPFCNPLYTDDVDCNQLLIQPNFSIPSLEVVDVVSGGTLISGVYQFAVQYSDGAGNAYTSYYSITNPLPIADPNITSVNFNYQVGKSIVVNISNLDSTGQFQYFNLAVIKTINGITSVELVGTYYIDNVSKKITYTGADVSALRLSINEIFEKYPYYDIAEDVTTAQDIIIWEGLTSIDRINYQKIANNISLQWESWRIPATENYADETNAANLKGYLRDEVYPYEIVFLLTNGKQTDGFHIPGRIKNPNEMVGDVPDTDPDFIGNPDYELGGVGYSPYWKIYNTGSVTGFSDGYSTDPSYKGPYQYGEFAYWESEEVYPCNEDVWGELSGQKIRHHKFPDVLVSPIFETKIFTDADSMAMGNDAIFPIGVRIDLQQVATLVSTSNLTNDQKDAIVGFKIVRGDRSTNKSIVAKGILRNVGKYTREEEEFYYPNYPYNDLREDPFLTQTNNAFEQICDVYDVQVTSFISDPSGGPDYADVQYTDCDNNKLAVRKILSTDLNVEICSTTKPVIISPAFGIVGLANYEEWYVINESPFTGVVVGWTDPIIGYTTLTLCGTVDTCSSVGHINVVIGTNGPQQVDGSGTFRSQLTGIHLSAATCGTTSPQPPFTDKQRQIFNSPETSFGQPFLGQILKLESVMYGSGKAHFTEVKDNARYKLLTEAIQRVALDSSNALGNVTSDFDGTAMFTAYQAYLQIYLNGLTRRNFAYSFNSIADYNYTADIPNSLGVKQRNVELSRYLIPGVQNVGDEHNINNFNRESSVFLKTQTDLPFPSNTPSLEAGGVPVVTDYSRFTISEIGHCNTPAKETDINVVAYYGSLKNNIINQWGQIYSYETIDTGFQKNISDAGTATVFGGDTFIGKFAFKTKLPFFIDNRVNAPDDSDVFYDEIGNVAYPKYWHSSRSILKDYMSNGGLLSNIIAYKAHNFDCPNDLIAEPVAETTTSTSTTSTTTTAAVGNTSESNTLSYYDGYFYLFAYGVPSFYCESSYNLDLRQAFNNKEGDFWPHVSSGIPDDWVQETFVTIAQDNTYYYNTGFSKQNKENVFTHLPIDWGKPCHTFYPFRAVYSDVQKMDADNTVNSWLNYKALSYFDFPQNFGKLTSLDGIQNRAVLARFENKTLMYNSLLTIDTSNPQAAFVGNPNMFANPPIDFAETDLGYIGSQHKFLLKIPQGQISVDAKRGQVFLIAGQGEAIDLSGFGSGMNRFFTDHLAFEILRYFPEVDVDNHFNGIGLHGVYDSKYDRVILTKIDYIPHEGMNIKYDAETKEFYLETIIDVPDTIFTTTSTTSTSTTTTTTTTTTSIPVDLPLVLTFSDILAVEPLVGDVTDFNVWNTFFDLPTLGNPFISVSVIDDVVNLYGASNVTLRDSLFDDPSGVGQYLLKVEDNAGCVVAGGYDCFGDWENNGCYSLTDLYFPEMLTAGEACFADTFALVNITMPKLTDAGADCFDGASALVSPSLPSLINAGVACFYDCSSLISPNFSLLETAGDYCFRNCSLLVGDFPSLITAGPGCFENCIGLTSSDFSSLQTAGDYCFVECVNLISDFSSLITAGNYCFYNCASLESSNFSSLTTAENMCFSGCVNLTNPNFLSLETVGYRCFTNDSLIGCHLLTSDFPSLLTAGNEAFYDCIGLVSPDFSNLTSAGNSCFANCTGLINPDFSSLITANAACFFGCSNLETGTFISLVTALDGCFQDNASLVDSFPVLTTVGGWTFQGCYVLNTNFSFISTAGTGCFLSCHSLVSPDFSSLVTAGDNCFQDCTSLVAPILPLLEYIGLGGFNGDVSLTALNLPNLLNLGPTVNGYDYVLGNISGKTITLTVPIALSTCNSGSPDTDITEFLSANPASSVVYV